MLEDDVIVAAGHVRTYLRALNIPQLTGECEERVQGLTADGSGALRDPQTGPASDVEIDRIVYRSLPSPRESLLLRSLRQ